MRVGEDLSRLHPQPHQGRDVEEAPVVELVARHPPVRQPVVLLIEQRIEGVGIGVECLQGGRLRRQRLDRLGGQRQHMVEVHEGEPVVSIPFDAQLSSLEHPAVVVAEDGHQQPVVGG